MDWIIGLVLHFLACAILLSIAGLFLGISFTVQQLFGIWILLLTLRIALYDNK